MKAYSILACIFVQVVACSGSVDANGGSDSLGISGSQTVIQAPVKPLMLADPFILSDGTYYYAYGTNSANGIEVYKSTDLKKWEGPCGNCEQGLALHKDNSTAIDRFWAPEVYPCGDGYAMVFSGSERARIAFSSSPLGPFKDEATYTPDQSSIDDHIFIDDDGQPYLFWVRFGLGKGNEIRCATLSDDWTSITSDQTECIHAEADWETIQGKVTEGPFILKHGGYYYLTYSANDYRCQDYAVGYAVATSPLGPWEKYSGNPILRRPGSYVGSGHHAFFKRNDGQLMIVFHIHNSAEQVQKRKMVIAPCNFVSDGAGKPDKLVVDVKGMFMPGRKD